MFKFMAILTINLVVAMAMLCCALPVLAGEIHDAVAAGDLALVKQILKKNPAALFERADNQFKEQPIHFAATTGNVEMARLLLDAGADIDAGDSDNSTALGIAAMRKHGDMVAFLIERGADVNRRDRKADCPLSFAVYGKDESIIKQLIEAGADLYFRNPNGETLLHISCARGVGEFVRHLLDNGAALEARSANGGTPLGYAAMMGQADIVRLLLERGADPNAGADQESSPLLFTAWRDRLECARLLLEHGADPNATLHMKNTALTIAAEGCSPEMLKLLIDHGARVNHQNESGETALIRAAAAGHGGRTEVLLAASADPNRGADRCGRTALQLAALGGYTAVARRLIDAGANLDRVTPRGQTALQLARYYGHTDLAKFLTTRGARDRDPAAVDRSIAALGDVGKKEAIIWFLGHSGWAVKTKNHLLIFDYFSQGETPASAALCNGHINPKEIKHENVAVFASHHHGDHFSPEIFEWKDTVANISYFLGLEPQDAPAYEFMPERMEQSFGDIDVTTIHSTDAGVGMIIEVDGLTIFHPGDHANGAPGLMDEFTGEIDFLAAKGIRPDICFMGIRGCSLGAPDEVKEGVYYTLKTLKPRVFIPMHAGTDNSAYHEFIDECCKQFEAVQMVAPDNRGDHFAYSAGAITNPREKLLSQAHSVH